MLRRSATALQCPDGKYTLDLAVAEQRAIVTLLLVRLRAIRAVACA